MENAKQAYDTFNRLWAKVPRHVRIDRDNHQLMLVLRTFFNDAMEIEKRRVAVVETTGEAPSDHEQDDDEQTDPVRLALRLLRTLTRREWEMVKAIVDLHKFAPEDFLDLLNTIHDVHCPRCGEWLDDDDDHDNCSAPEDVSGDDAEEEIEPASTHSVAAKRLPVEATHAPPSAPPAEELDELDE